MATSNRIIRNTLDRDTEIPNKKIHLVHNYLSFKDIYLKLTQKCLYT